MKIETKEIKDIFKDDEWLTLENIPPDNQLVKVIDCKGNMAYAYATWYPWKQIQNEYGQWKSELCEPYWDGGWLIVCEALTPPNIGKIIGWKK